MGTLYIVSTPIGNLGDMSPRAIATLRAVDLIAAEDTRHTGRLLRHFDIATPTLSYHNHNRSARHGRLLAALAIGDVALVSDAGTPAIADPGHELVAAAIAAGHRVVPIPGASSLLAAVAASGIVPGPFLFVGFLSRGGSERAVALSLAMASGVPFVLFESPLRTASTLEDIADLDASRSVVVARELTKVHEDFRRGPVVQVATELRLAPPRGEVVIVVGGPGEPPADPAGTAEDVARSILRQGVKPSRAARELASITGISATEAYDIVQRIRQKSSPGE